jgi:hypothetical protein
MTTDDDTSLKSYAATVGVYVRTYGHFKFEAENDQGAPAAAIAAFKECRSAVFFEDIDWNNLAQPCIVSIDDADDSDRIIAEGIDFPLSEGDARDFASAELLAEAEKAVELMKRASMAFNEKGLRAAIAKANGTEPETAQPEPEGDKEPEQRSTAELIDAILDMLADTELTSDDIIDNCRFFAEILQHRFPLPQDTRIVATLMNELQKAEG